MLKLKPGMTIWLACEVKPGPFANERTVKVESEEGAWLGFVDLTYLRDRIQAGNTYIRAYIVDVTKDHFTAQLPGHSVGASRKVQRSQARMSGVVVPA